MIPRTHVNLCKDLSWSDASCSRLPLPFLLKLTWNPSNILRYCISKKPGWLLNLGKRDFGKINSVLLIYTEPDRPITKDQGRTEIKQVGVSLSELTSQRCPWAYVGKETEATEGRWDAGSSRSATGTTSGSFRLYHSCVGRNSLSEKTTMKRCFVENWESLRDWFTPTLGLCRCALVCKCLWFQSFNHQAWKHQT